MDRGVEVLMTSLQAVMAAWLRQREERRAIARRMRMRPITFPMVETAAEEALVGCC
jgi:hypothetical protein